MNSHASPEEIEEWRGERREESERVRQLRQAASGVVEPSGICDKASGGPGRRSAVGGKREIEEDGAEAGADRSE